MQPLLRFFRLPMKQRCLLIEALLLTGLARIAILILPFRWIAPWVGRHTEVSRESTDEQGIPVMQDVAWAVRVISARTPWQSKCLVQAMTARFMLGRRKVAGTIYLGLCKAPSGELKAHAWLRSGDKILTGQGGMKDYTVVSSFAFGTPSVVSKTARSSRSAIAGGY